MSARRAVAIAWLVAAAWTPAGAQPPGPSKVAWLATHYHLEPAALDVARVELERAVVAGGDVAHLVSLARISYIWGDVRAQGKADRLAAYERGRDAARQALDRAPENVDARFWYAVNIGRWAETKGMFSALRLVSTIKQEIAAVLERDPTYTDAYGFAGNLYYELPRFLDGDVDRAERMFRKGLDLAPTSTGMRIGLAKVLIRKGRPDEARVELQRVLQERTPGNLAEWTLRHVEAAKAMLRELR